VLWRNSPTRRRRIPSSGFISPAQPTLVAKPPSGSTWLHEVKHDGYRILARKQGGRVKLWSRHGTDFTNRLPRIAEAVRDLPAERAVVDGEAVVFLKPWAPVVRYCSVLGWASYSLSC
jgi:bifunctional non-homologous end joining protein LigD